MFDVVAMGELLIDFTPSGYAATGNMLYEKNPGGAPANVLAAVSKLGRTSAFLGMVGNDQHGIFLKNILEENKIDTTGLKFSQEFNTTLAFVHLDKSGDRTFSFYRNPGADMMYSKNDIDYDVVKNGKVFHFGSISMTDEPVRSATIKAVEYARKQGCLISYDPNLRPPLWKNLKEARENILIGLKYADILKLSEEELEFITDNGNLVSATSDLYSMGISAILVTLGAKGCFYRYKGGSGRLDTYDTKVVDTTGAGDAFLGGILYKLCNMDCKAISEMDRADFERVIDFGNAMGSFCATKRGAIPAMPDITEVEKCMKEVPRVIAENI